MPCVSVCELFNKCNSDALNKGCHVKATQDLNLHLKQK